LTSHNFFCASHKVDEGDFLHHFLVGLDLIRYFFSPLSLITSTMRKQGLNECGFKHPNGKPSVRRTFLSLLLFLTTPIKQFIGLLGGTLVPAFSSLIIMGLKGLKKGSIYSFYLLLESYSYPIYSSLLNPPYSYENNKKHNMKHNTFFVMFGSGVVKK